MDEFTCLISRNAIYLAGDPSSNAEGRHEPTVLWVPGRTRIAERDTRSARVTKNEAGLRVAFEFGTVQIREDLACDLREERLALIGESATLAGRSRHEPIGFKHL